MTLVSPVRKPSAPTATRPIDFRPLPSAATGFNAMEGSICVATLMHAPVVNAKLQEMHVVDAWMHAEETSLGYLHLDGPGSEHARIQQGVFDHLVKQMPELQRVSTTLSQLSHQEILEQRFAGLSLKDAALTTGFVRAWARLGFELTRADPLVDRSGSTVSSEVKVSLKRVQTTPLGLPPVMPLRADAAQGRRVALSPRDTQQFLAALLEGKPRELALKETRAYLDAPVAGKAILLRFEEGYEPIVEVAARRK